MFIMLGAPHFLWFPSVWSFLHYLMFGFAP